jgi:hypothetical protein
MWSLTPAMDSRPNVACGFRGNPSAGGDVVQGELQTHCHLRPVRIAERERGAIPISAFLHFNARQLGLGTVGDCGDEPEKSQRERPRKMLRLKGH